MPEASPSPEAPLTTWAMVVSMANATSSSSSIEVSSAYCSNAGARSSPWAAEGIKSTLIEQVIVLGLCEKFRIPADYKPSCAGGDGRACKAPPHLEGCICVYEAALDAGMRVPLHPFYSKLLQHYGLAPSQLTPNSWRYMAAFIVLCSDAGLEPRLSVFRHFFRVCAYTHGNRDGRYIIKPHKMSEDDRDRRLFSTSSWQLPNNDGWKERFFFLSSSTGNWPCPITWGNPTREAAGDPKLSIKAKQDIQKMCNVQESSCFDLMSLLAEEKLAAVLVRATPMKKDVNSGNTVNVSCPPPGGSLTHDQVPMSVLDEDGDDWLRTVLKKTADKVINESSFLRQQLNEARQSETAAKAELIKAHKSEMANKADLDNVRKSEAAAKAQLVATQAELAAARAEIDKIRKSEATAKAEQRRKSKSEAAAKAEITATKAELISTKAQLDEVKKSEASTKAKLAAAKVMVQKTGNEYLEDFVRLHNLMMDGFESAFGMVRKSQQDASLPVTDNGNNDP